MKNQYRIRNWSEYNAGLKLRGSLTFWLDEKVVGQWLVKNKTGKKGESRNIRSSIRILSILFFTYVGKCQPCLIKEINNVHLAKQCIDLGK